ncbi:MAG: hypothetical protein Q4C79_13000, partial [Neisseria sp.]|uniref:hypothetical protein n=1 Tax=Neisseria sp. TaxID=192066 RepID=UPI0026DD9FE0
TVLTDKPFFKQNSAYTNGVFSFYTTSIKHKRQDGKTSLLETHPKNPHNSKLHNAIEQKD